MTDLLREEPQLGVVDTLMRLEEQLSAHGIDARRAHTLLQHYTALHDDIREHLDGDGDWANSRGRMLLSILKGCADVPEMSAAEQEEFQRAAEETRTQLWRQFVGDPNVD